MKDVLMGRVDPPINRGIATLMEVSNAYFARGKEIEMHFLEQERLGVITRGSGSYKFRTGELRSFLELAKAVYEMGSRRITLAQMDDPSY